MHLDYCLSSDYSATTVTKVHKPVLYLNTAHRSFTMEIPVYPPPLYMYIPDVCVCMYICRAQASNNEFDVGNH